MSAAPTLVNAFVGGGLAVGYAVAGAFFLQFWRRTGDSLFAIFAAAFALMALHQSLLILLGIPREEASPLYLLRAAAFLLIIVGVLRKNLDGGASR